MREFYRRCDLFFLRNRDKGIANLILYVAIGNAAVYIFTLLTRNPILFERLYFDPVLIRRGELWRLISFLLVPTAGTDFFGGLMQFVFLFFYFQIGRILERTLGVCKFNLFYFTGVVLMDLFGTLLYLPVTVDTLNMSLLLAFAVAYPEGQVLLFYIIPLKVKYLAWFYAALTVLEILFSRSLTPLIPLLNFLLFFWRDIPRLFPAGRVQKRKPAAPGGSAPRNASAPKPYHHKCTICGRTDAEYPHLEFRYCSRCRGYHCYCMDHINNHPHIQ